MRGVRHCGTLVVLAAVCGGWTSGTPVEKVLYSFQGGSDGGIPYAGLTYWRGAFYGATDVGGSQCGRCGYVYKLTPPAGGGTAWPKTVLFEFPADGDGANPQARLVFDRRGAIYGTTSSGGIGFGTIFKLTPPASGQARWTETVLHRFSGGKDGAVPYGTLLLDDRGALFGTTASGGMDDNGVVFRLTPPRGGETAWRESVLYSFTGGADGGSPLGGVIADAWGGLYGTTTFGGSANLGTVFRINPAGHGPAWSETVLHSFAGGGDGAQPVAGLVADRFGTLYGATSQGGAGMCAQENGCGTIFELSPPTWNDHGWSETVLHSFAGGGDGSFANSTLLVGGDGALYGATVLGGGSGCGGSGCGTVFRLTRPNWGQGGWGEKVLHQFTGGSDGAGPTSVLFRDEWSGRMFGTASGGGAGNCSIGNCGVVFELSGVRPRG